MTYSRDVDATPTFPRQSQQWTDWGWPEQVPTDPQAVARQRDLDEDVPEPKERA